MALTMLPDIGQVVLYSLTEEQAQRITERRLQNAAAGFGPGPGVLPGDAVPMLVASCASGYDDGVSAVAGRLLIDDVDDDWWVTSVTEGVAPGAWRLV
jgi:hypothetical protein